MAERPSTGMKRGAEERVEEDRAKSDGVEKDRRQHPRFNCGGSVEIQCLPSNGIFVPGTVRDLSRNGCCIDTALPIENGMRAEIVVRVKTASFRAVGEVRAIRLDNTAGIEFVRLSARGKDLLDDLVRELAELEAAIAKLRSGNSKIDPDPFSREMDYRRLQAEMLSTRFPGLSFPGLSLDLATDPEENSEPASRPGQIVPAKNQKLEEIRKLVLPVDLFG